jgi:hypothetical protein
MACFTIDCFTFLQRHDCLLVTHILLVFVPILDSLLTLGPEIPSKPPLLNFCLALHINQLVLLWVE